MDVSSHYTDFTISVNLAPGCVCVEGATLLYDNNVLFNHDIVIDIRCVLKTFIKIKWQAEHAVG